MLDLKEASQSQHLNHTPLRYGYTSPNGLTFPLVLRRNRQKTRFHLGRVKILISPMYVVIEELAGPERQLLSISEKLAGNIRVKALCLPLTVEEILLGTIQFHDLQGKLGSADHFNPRYQNIQFHCCILTSAPMLKVSRSINTDRENQCKLSNNTQQQPPLSLPLPVPSNFM